jgi:hypothetical protein
MIKNFEDELKRLLKGEFTNIILDYNDHSVNYQTAMDYYTDPRYHKDSSFNPWISNAEKKKALENNSVWCLTVYPDTPIGSYQLKASSLDALYNYLVEQNND